MITRSQAIELYASDDLIRIGMEADAVRRRLHPQGIVSYGSPDRYEESAIVEFVAGESAGQALDRLDEIQDAMHKGSRIVAVLPTTNNTAVEYLKVLALTRLYLTGIDHVQTSLENGAKLVQIALRFGANDICGAQPPNSTRRPHATEEQLRLLIRDAGFIPKQRDALFRLYALN